MAHTKINTQVIPDGTIVSADLTMPITDFSSTGIDDNATSTAITIDSSERVGINITPTTRALEVKSIANAQIITSFKTGSGLTGRIAIMDANTTADNTVGIGCTGNNLDFYAGAAAKATLSDLGNLSVIGNLTSRGIDDNASATVMTVAGGSSGNNSIIQSVNSNYGSGFYGSSANFGFEITDGGVGGKTIRIKNNSTDIFSHNQVQNIIDMSNASSVTVAGFTSTGIDDNATSTAITINGSSANQVTLKSTNSPVEVVGLLAVPTSGYNYNLQCMDSRAFNTPGNGGGIGFGYQINSSENYEVGAVIQGYKDNNTSGDMAGGLRFSTRVNNQNPSIRMTISSAGNVGIGETAPLALLHVKAIESSTGETDPIARFERFTTGDNHYLDITLDNSTNMVGFQSTGTSNGGFTFGGASTDLVTISNNGNVDVSGTLHASYFSFGNTNSLLYESADDFVNIRIGASGPYMAFEKLTATDVAFGNASGALDIVTSGGAAISIDTSRNVGIGTTTVGQFGGVDVGLTVDGGGAYSGIAVTDGATTGSLTQGYSTTYLYNQANGNMLFGTNNTERMRISSAGNVGIGDSSPSNLFTLKSASQYQGLTIKNASNIIADLVGFGSGNDAGGLKLYNGGSSKVQLLSNGGSYLAGGNVSIGTTVTTRGRLTVEGVSPATNNNTLALVSAAGSSKKAGISFYGTFVSPTADVTPRRTADITSGFSTANWLTEYMAFHVGTGASNDAFALNTERVRITGAGRFLVGATDIAANVKAVIQASNGEEALRLTNASGGSGDVQGETYLGFHMWQSNSATGYVHSPVQIGIVETSIADYDAHLVFKTRSSNADIAPTERVRITDAGRVGINTSSPGNTLHVAGGIRFSASGTDANRYNVYWNSSTGDLVVVASDKRLKKDFDYDIAGIETVNKLKPVRFSWKENNKRQLGFAAQESFEADEHLAWHDTEKDQWGLDGWEGYAAVLTKAIQEQQAMIETLQAQVAALE